MLKHECSAICVAWFPMQQIATRSFVICCRYPPTLLATSFSSLLPLILQPLSSHPSASIPSHPASKPAIQPSCLYRKPRSLTQLP